MLLLRAALYYATSLSINRGPKKIKNAPNILRQVYNAANLRRVVLKFCEMFDEVIGAIIRIIIIITIIISL